jgi:hypothetical protein
MPSPFKTDNQGGCDDRDLSYVRPLQIDTPTPELWQIAQTPRSRRTLKFQHLMSDLREETDAAA